MYWFFIWVILYTLIDFILLNNPLHMALLWCLQFKVLQESHVWAQQSQWGFSKCSTVLLVFGIRGELCQCWAVCKSSPSLPDAQKEGLTLLQMGSREVVYSHLKCGKDVREKILSSGLLYLKGTSCAWALENLFSRVTGSITIWLTIELQPLRRFTGNLGTTAITVLVL